MKFHIDNSRREFLRKLIAGTSAMGMAPLMTSLQSCAGPGPVLKIPQRAFGKTGEMVGIYSLGAQATCEQLNKREQAVAIINRAIDLGINYIDTGEHYMGGRSEKIIGEVIKNRERKSLFITTKINLNFGGAPTKANIKNRFYKCFVISIYL